MDPDPVYAIFEFGGLHDLTLYNTDNIAHFHASTWKFNGLSFFAIE